ncbi:MAG: hypothetical protein MRY83_20045 [Flavobacteriales bacterium]|nr:hypothetical protein [Flavobacteriales bacterium]
MEIDFTEVYQTIKAISGHIEWLSIAKYLFFGFGIGLVGSVVLLIVLRKLIFVKRRNLFFKVLMWVWAICIPLLSIFSGLKYGFIHGIQKNIEHEVEQELAVLSNQLGELVGEEWGAALTTGNYECKTCDINPIYKLTPHNGIEVGVVIVMDQYESFLDELVQAESSFVQKVALILKKTIQVKAISWAVEKGLAKLLNGYIDEEVTEELFDTQLKDFLKDGLLAKIINLQIEKLFGSLKMSTLITFALMLLIPLAEIVYANIYNNRNTALPAPAEN